MKTVTVDLNTFKLLDDARMRLNRIERDLRLLEETIREQSVGEQDGYILQIADDIQRILA